MSHACTRWLARTGWMVLVLMACGDSGTGLGNQNDGGPGPDTATSDASLLDAAPDPDGALPDGTVPDAALDGAVIDPDNDQDGYPASQDCDDSDDEVYPGVRRDCQSDCDNGTQTCLLTGTWSTCTAPTDCDCTSPGDTRVVDCGNCGQASQECGLDLHWGFPGTCLGEGECSPGEQFDEPCPLCGTITHLCNQQCAFDVFDDCSGVCSPGDTQDATSFGCTNLYEVHPLECDATCEWVGVDPCSPDCRIPARVGNGDFKDEVCIPGGPFLMGCDPDEGVAGERPKHNVQLTPYLIDVYEVTNARYRACVDDGVCTAPLAGSTYFTTGLDALPVAGVSWDQATVFCDWDGGRHLPSEAQWEKAARGPAPSEVNMPWGADPPTCDLTIGEGCLYSGLAQPWPVDARPAGASFYGVQQMAGNVDEWCQDYSSASYYSVSPLLDPPGPATGTHRIIRGMNFSVSLAAQAESVFARMGTSATTQRSSLGIRCARRGF